MERVTRRPKGWTARSVPKLSPLLVRERTQTLEMDVVERKGTLPSGVKADGERRRGGKTRKTNMVRYTKGILCCGGTMSSAATQPFDVLHFATSTAYCVGEKKRERKEKTNARR